MEGNTFSINNQLYSLSETSRESLLQKLNSILDKLPLYLRDFIDECFIHKRTPREYQFLSVLFAFATASGKTFYTNELNYKNYPNIYGLIIGNRSDGKSEGIKMATKELVKQDDIFHDDYEKDKEKNADEDRKPILKQLLVKDASIEALKLNHYKCPNGIGIMIDEILPLLHNMESTTSRDGKEYLSFLLDNFINSNISCLTKSVESFRLKESCCSLIGGLQKQFLNILFKPKLLSSGFLDRLLCVNLIQANHNLTKQNINPDIVQRYNQAIRNILDYKLQSEEKDETNKSFEITYTNDAKDRLFDFSQELENIKVESKAPLKEYVGKASIYLHKLCIIVFLVKRAENKYFKEKLEVQEVELAYEIVEFFIMNFVKLIDQKSENTVSVYEIIKLAKQNNATQKSVVEITGLSKGQVSKLWNKI